MAKDLPTEYHIGAKKYDKNLNEDVLINVGILNDEFAEHAAKFAWYATAFELCEAEVSKEKDKLSHMEACLDYQVRNEFTMAEVKATEAKVHNQIITNPEYIKQQDLLREAEKNAGLAKAARDAMMHRKDMLVGLGANYRAEGQSDTSLRITQKGK